MNLSFPLSSHISFEGHQYRLNLGFDNVLRVFEVQRDPLFDKTQRLLLAVELLAGKRAARLPVIKQADLLQRIIAEYITPDAKPHDPGEPRVLDWVQDASLIFASFLQAYGINLAEQRGRLDWRYFYALFQGLPEDTKIREVMRIRRQPIPVPTKDNSEQIKAITEAKQFYALKISEDEAQETFQAGVDRMAAALIGRAKREVFRLGRRQGCI